MNGLSSSGIYNLYSYLLRFYTHVVASWLPIDITNPKPILLLNEMFIRWKCELNSSWQLLFRLILSEDSRTSTNHILKKLYFIDLRFAIWRIYLQYNLYPVIILIYKNSFVQIYINTFNFQRGRPIKFKSLKCHDTTNIFVI